MVATVVDEVVGSLLPFACGDGSTVEFTVNPYSVAPWNGGDPVFHHYSSWQGTVGISSGARTNRLLRSTLAGASAAPTGWSQPVATGTSAPATSIFDSGDGAQAYAQAATGQRPMIKIAVALEANKTYVVSCIVESITGAVIAANVMSWDGTLSGASISFPPCQANPNGGTAGVVRPGILIAKITTTATAGNDAIRVGLGCSSAATGTLQFSRPMVEDTALASRGKWIPTTTAAAAVTDYTLSGTTLTMAAAPATGDFLYRKMFDQLGKLI